MPEEEHSPGLLDAERPMKVGLASTAKEMTTLGVIPAAECSSLERPVPWKGARRVRRMA